MVVAKTAAEARCMLKTILEYVAYQKRENAYMCVRGHFFSNFFPILKHFNLTQKENKTRDDDDDDDDETTDDARRREKRGVVKERDLRTRGF